MKMIPLGNTDLTVSKIALGCWGFAGGSMWGDQEETASVNTVAAAIDVGINFFETAQGYGNGYSEEVLGRALKGHREKAVIATKIRPSDGVNGIIAACELSLKRLQTDYIDLLQPHWPNRQISPKDTYLAFDKLKEQGKIRAFGVSNYGVGDLGDILEFGEIASNQLPYSLLFRAIEYEILPLCREKNVGILSYSTLLHGLLAGKYSQPNDIPDGRARTKHFSMDRINSRHEEDGCELEMFATLDDIRTIAANIGQPMALVAVAWVLQQPGVAVAILGARTPHQIREMAAVTEVQLDPKTLKKLTNMTESIKKILGPDPDMWSAESRFR